MEAVWTTTRRITRSPCLALCFKRSGRTIESNSVCFLEMDRVDWRTKWCNSKQNQFLPRNCDEAAILHQLKDKGNETQNLNLTLGGFLNQALHLYFGAEWKPFT